MKNDAKATESCYGKCCEEVFKGIQPESRMEGFCQNRRNCAQQVSRLSKTLQCLRSVLGLQATEAMRNHPFRVTGVRSIIQNTMLQIHCAEVWNPSTNIAAINQPKKLALKP